MSSQHLGPYRVIKRLGAGGMGEVSLAVKEGPRGFQKVVVIKRLHSHLTQDRSLVDGFVKEARLVALLSHPNIVHVFELGEAEGDLYIAMEYVHGRTLRALVRRAVDAGEVLPPGAAARIAIDALAGLEYAHTFTHQGQPLGLIHRDATPENILVGSNGMTKLVDFGVARALSGTFATDTGRVKGKFPYMAPEQIRNEAIDARLDVYSIGVCLYEMLTGRHPFDFRDEAGAVFAVLSTPPADPRSLRPMVPDALAMVVMRAIAKKADQRFSSAKEMSAAISRWVDEAGVDASANAVAQTMHRYFKDVLDDEKVIVEELESGEVASAPLRTRAIRPPAQAADEPPLKNVKKLPSQSNLKTQPGGSTFRGWHLGAASAVLAFLVAATGVVLRREPPHPPPPLFDALLGDAGPGVTAVVDAGASLDAVGIDLTEIDSGVAVLDEAPPVRKPPKVTRTPKSMASGSLVLLVKPWGELFENGKSLGTTPLEAPLQLSVGDHQIEVRNKDLKKSRTVKVTVRSGKNDPVKIDLNAP